MSKLPGIDSYDGPYWVGHPDAGTKPGAPARTLVERRADLWLVGYVADDTRSYEYSEAAVVDLDGQLYLLHTAGCSCPSPSETWSVIAGPADAEGIAAAIRSDKEMYLNDKMRDELLAALSRARGEK